MIRTPTILRNVAAKTVQHRKNLLRIAEELDPRWFEVKCKNPNRKFSRARRLPDGRFLLAVGGGSRIALAYTADEAKKLVEAVRKSDKSIQYLSDEQQIWLQKDFARVISNPKTEADYPIKERWFHVQPKRSVGQNQRYFYAKRRSDGKLWLWDGSYSLHSYTLDEAMRFVETEKVNGKLRYVFPERFIEMEENFQHYLHR